MVALVHNLDPTILPEGSAKLRWGGEGGQGQRWANLDQASKHLEVFRFRDLSPTPKP